MGRTKSNIRLFGKARGDLEQALLVFVLSGTAIMGVFCWLLSGVSASAETITDTGSAGSATITMAITPGVLDLAVEPSPTGVEVSDDISVSITTDSPEGYQLYMNTATSDTSLRHEKLNDKEIEATANATADELDNNTWGYNVNVLNAADFLAVPSVEETPVLLADAQQVVTDDVTTVTLGTKVDTLTVAGTYSTGLVFTAMANYIPSIDIYTISPDVGPTGGGQTVTITGLNFLKDRVKIVKVSSGEVHTMALDDQGNVYIWGSNASGQLGVGTYTGTTTCGSGSSARECSLIPIKLNGLNTVAYSNALTEDTVIVDISAGVYHSMAIDDKGNLYMWGLDAAGQVGDGTVTTNHAVCYTEDCVKAPIKISGMNPNASGGTLTNGLSSAWIEQISGGMYHSVAVDNAGNVYAWGADIYGQVGDGSQTTNHMTLSTGLGNVDCAVAPVKLTGVSGGSYTNMLEQATIAGVSAGAHHTLVVDDENNLYAWGYDNYGQIGDGTITTNHVSTNNVVSPIKLTGLTTGTQTNALISAQIDKVGTGYNHSFAIDLDGNLYAWGYDRFGQVGDGSVTTNHTGSGSYNVSAPVMITGLNGGTGYDNALISTQVEMVTGGESHTVAIGKDGNVYAWGLDYNGQVGDGNLTVGHYQTNNVLAPKNLSTLANPNASGSTSYVNALYGVTNGLTVAAGELQSFAVDGDGNLYAWGLDSYGEIGDGSLTSNHSGSNVVAPINLSVINSGTNVLHYLNGVVVTVMLGTAPCTNVTIIDDSTLTCVTSASGAGTVDVILTVGDETVVLRDGYTYQ